MNAVNIGLQPQYPTLWWIDSILLALAVLAALEELIITPRIIATRKARLEAEHEKAKADYDSRHKAYEVELAHKGKDEVGYWYDHEPQFMYRPSEVEPPPVGWGIGIVSGIVLACTLLATVIVCVPFNTKYYNFYTVTGTVKQVVSAVQVDDDTVSSDFTVALTGDPQRYSLSDTRVKTLVGEKVTLVCGIGWNNQAADSWNCNLRSFNGSTR